MFTNTPPNGAFRGLRRAADAVRRRGAHGPDRRERWASTRCGCASGTCFAPGDTTATGQVLGDDAVRSARSCATAVRRSDYQSQAHGLRGDQRRGIGLALFWHGSGFTGSGELKLASRATVELTADRGAACSRSSTEIGQGTRTMHAQIVADALGIPYEQVEVPSPTPRVVPDSGPTVASRTCMVVGEDPASAPPRSCASSWAT